MTMKKNSTNTGAESAPDFFEMITDTMIGFRETMETHDNLGVKIAARTRLILRVVLTTLIISAIYLVFMIYQMSNNMNAMTVHLEDMYSSFGSMSGDMHEITQTADSMARSISGMPLIAESMNQISGDVSAMTGSVHAMKQSMTAMDNDMTRINANMHEMTGRLYNMNRSVNLMGNDVNQMAAPMNSGPMSGFWPR